MCNWKPRVLVQQETDMSDETSLSAGSRCEMVSYQQRTRWVSEVKSHQWCSNRVTDCREKLSSLAEPPSKRSRSKWRVAETAQCAADVRTAFCQREQRSVTSTLPLQCLPQTVCVCVWENVLYEIRPGGTESDWCVFLLLDITSSRATQSAH